MYGKSFLATAFIITVATFISKAIGFLREVCIGYFYGPSELIDIYLMVTSIPNIIAGVVGCIGSAYIPVYTDIRWKEGPRKADGFTSYISVLLIAICFALSAWCILRADYVIRAFAPGFTGNMAFVAEKYIQITIFNVVFLVLANLFSCYLRCNENFIVPPISLIIHGIVQIAVVAISAKYGDDYLIYGTVISNIIYLLVLLISILGSGYRFERFYSETKYVKSLGKLSAPLLAGTFLVQGGSYIDTFFASFLATGSVSEIYYARLISMFAVTMLTTGIMSMFSPVISDMATRGKMGEIQKMFRSCLIYMVCGLFPVACLFFVLSYDIIDVLFGRGKFGGDAIQMTSMALKMYAVGISANGICDLFYNLFYSLQNSKKPLWMNCYLILWNIGLDYFLIRWMGLAGLALGASLSAVLTFLIGFFFLREFMDAKGLLLDVMRILVKVGFISVMAMGPVFFFKELWPVHGFGFLSLDCIMFVALYGALLWRVHIPEIELLVQKMKNRRKGEAV